MEAVIDSFLPEELAVKVSSPRIIGLRKVEFGSFNLWFQQTNLLKLNDLSISLNPFFETQFLPLLLRVLHYLAGIFYPLQTKGMTWSSRNFSSNRSPKRIYFLLDQRLALVRFKQTSSFTPEIFRKL